jgi:hypothetical protein
MESIDQVKMQANQIRRKSKKLLAFTFITVATSAMAANANAQTFAEWFKQKSTQKKYLLEQIAALKVYASYYRMGNNIAHNGLGSITGWLNSEYGLHSFHYNQLQQVNPVVKNNKQVSDIVKWQNDILSRVNKLDKTKDLTADERHFIGQVKTALLTDCNARITELQTVISESKLKMTDEERLKHIGAIHGAMRSNYLFASTFADQVKLYAVQRKKESNSVAAEKKIYGIH